MRESAMSVSIGSRVVAANRPCYVIAEAGVNHNGDLDAVERLVDEAARAGADCVKFQTFRAERLASAGALKAPYQLRTTDPAESQLEMLRALELTDEGHERAIAACKRAGVTFLSTPYDVADVDFLASLGVEAYKIASAFIVEPELLRRVAATGRPVILSTGLATFDEVRAAVAMVRKEGNDQIVVLQCTTDYPARIEDANLRAIQTMRQELDVLAGYSDHTTTATTAVAAVALGAVMIEKHITLDKRLPGPDHAASADPAEFAAFVASIRAVETALGSGTKEPSDVERVNIVGMRRSVVAARAIPAGTTLTRELLALKRPAGGIAPWEMDTVIGTVTRVALEADQPLNWALLSNPARVPPSP